eukprot:scaffold49973_cov66-Phaeocystis_antarctica.AAC.2
MAKRAWRTAASTRVVTVTAGGAGAIAGARTGTGFTSMVVTAASFASAAALASVSAATLTLASTATLASIFAAFFAIVAEACTCTRPLRSPPKLSSRSRWGSIPSDAWSVSVSNAEVHMRCACGANGPGMR